MKPTPATEIITALLGGSSAEHLSESIRTLSSRDHRELCCTLCCMRNEVAANCRERADEIDRFLSRNSCGDQPINCGIYEGSCGWCPLIGDAPLDVRKVNTVASLAFLPG
jgi:hypothetical protein